MAEKTRGDGRSPAGEDKIRVGVLFGGRSCEHEVSVTSARSILASIDRSKYDVTMIGISKEGRWLVAGDATQVLDAGIVAGDDLLPVVLDYPGSTLMSVESDRAEQAVDVIFPILHGPFGEDGTVQGLLELAGVAYVGSGVVGSAVGMDKEMMKRAFRGEGIPQVDYRVVRRNRWRLQPASVKSEIEATFSYPLFIKPVNMGSSVGVVKAHDDEEFAKGMNEAAEYDYKIIIEAEAVDCREVEISVLGNENPQTSVIGEVVPGNEFYDYDAKYVDDNSELHIPAQLRPETERRIAELAVKVFQTVEAAGMGRVDFFVRREDEFVFVNEINTIPGFTPISMYPKLWEASGVPYAELIDRLIQLALERREDRRNSRAVL